MMDSFKDKTALVVGGTDAVGQAICSELVELGATVAVCEIDQTKVDQ